MEDISEKKCGRCGEVKPLDAFHRSKGNRDGRHRRCKLCRSQTYEPTESERSRARAKYAEDQAHRARENERVRSWKAANPEAVRVHNARRRALIAGAEQDGHTWEELLESWEERGLYGCVLQGPRCTGEPETVEHVIPLDRGGSHTVGNLVPSCAPCNLSKGTRLLSEWQETFDHK